MKTSWALFPLVTVMLGCSALPPGAGQDAGGWMPDASPPEQAGRMMLVMPATGGPPVQAISLGGTLYVPVNGDPPTVGTPLGP